MEDVKAPNAVHSFKLSDLKLVLVTVYNDRADVKRLKTLQLESGVNEIIFENISSKAEPESVRVDVSDSVIIHEVQVKCKNQSELMEEMTPEMKALHDEKKELEEKKRIVEDKEKISLRQNEVLDKILGEIGESVVKPKDKESPVVIDENAFTNVQNLFTFYGTKSLEIRATLREIRKQISELDEEVAKIASKIDKLRFDDRRFCRNVHVTVEVKEAQQVNMYIGYQVNCASWYPIYDLRLREIQSSQSGGKAYNLQLVYHGMVHQNTEEDWEDTPLKLSTAQPSLGAAIPKLGTLKAYIFRPPPPPVPRAYEVRSKRANAVPASASLFGSVQEDFMELDQCTGASIVPITTSDHLLSTIFDVPRQVTIASDSGDHKITFAVLSFSPTMSYQTVPLKNTNVFLTATVTNDSIYPLLSGEASVYLEHSFVTKTQMKAVSPGEIFQCSLGVDPTIKVEYKPAHKYTEQVGILSRSVIKSTEQKIVIKNTKQEEVKITIKDHVPKSSDEKIKIKLFSPVVTVKETVNTESASLEPGVRLNTNHNLLWTVLLQPMEERELLIKWSVEHPDSERIDLREEH